MDKIFGYLFFNLIHFHCESNVDDYDCNIVKQIVSQA